MMKYFKITNKKENHNGFQYVNGLNILDKPFEETGSCVSGGFYFSDTVNILKFLPYGIYLREITFPESDPGFKMIKDPDPGFKMIKDPDGDKWRANKIILGDRKNLSERSTWEYLITLGAKFLFCDALRWASIHGFLDIIEFMVEKGAKLENFVFILLSEASENGHVEIIEYLIRKEIDFGCRKDYIIEWASENNHLKVLEFLIGKEVNHAINTKNAISLAAKNGHLDVVKFLIERDADLINNCGKILKKASKKGQVEIVKYLVGKGIRSNYNASLKVATLYGHHEIAKFLTDNKESTNNCMTNNNQHKNIKKFNPGKNYTCLNNYLSNCEFAFCLMDKNACVQKN